MLGILVIWLTMLPLLFVNKNFRESLFLLSLPRHGGTFHCMNKNYNDVGQTFSSSI